MIHGIKVPVGSGTTHRDLPQTIFKPHDNLALLRYTRTLMEDSGQEDSLIYLRELMEQDNSNTEKSKRKTEECNLQNHVVQGL